MLRKETARDRVLISIPGAAGSPRPYLPYTWAVLRSHWERFGDDADRYEWLDPIFENDQPEDLLAPYAGDTIHVLGLSCYTWNWDIQIRIAELVRRDQPDCLVIAGGPHPDYKDPRFFAKHPYIDAIVVKDGEIPFTKILSKLSRGDRDLRDVTGLYLPDGESGRPVSTGPAEVPVDFDYSPYLDHREFFEEAARTHPLGFDAIWETNRGCPYSCSYCDWGSNTMSKLRRFDMKRVRAEADWLGRVGVNFLFEADANFGMLERDLEIAELISHSKQKYGHPTDVYYSPAKNHPDRCVQVAKIFSQSGLSDRHCLSIQHTNPEVLAATDRSNISTDKMIEVARAVQAARIPIDVQLILGIPGDSYAKWKGCLADLMEWGIHEDYAQTFFYHLLPNAPAASKSYREEWEIETIPRFIPSEQGFPMRKEDRGRLARLGKSHIIVQTRTFSRSDWVKMATYTAFVRALHNGSLTQRIAVYLRLSHDVSYLDFYEQLVERFLPTAPVTRQLYRTIEAHYQEFLVDEGASDHLEVEQLPSFPYALDPCSWVLVQTAMRSDDFFSELRGFLKRAHPGIDKLDSIVDFQQDTLILPSYDRQAGKSFTTDHDWIRYFRAARGRTGDRSLAEPEACPGAVVEVADQICGERALFRQPLDWEAAQGDERWMAWIERTVLWRKSSVRNNFQNLSLRVSAAA